MRTRVFLTTDTEFSIGGALERPDSVQPTGARQVLCDVAGRSGGLGSMLDIFAAHSLRATFTVGALQAAYFDNAPMAAMAQCIALAGHDLQFDLHPAWTYFDNPQWQSDLARKKTVDSEHARMRAATGGRIATRYQCL